MLMSARVLRIWVGLVLLYLLGAALCTYWYGDEREFIAFAGLPPFVLAHLLHQAGVPGVLEHGGRCGWGWCEPTRVGWGLGVVLIAGVLWGVACLVGWGWRRVGRSRR